MRKKTRPVWIGPRLVEKLRELEDRLRVRDARVEPPKIGTRCMVWDGEYGEWTVVMFEPWVAGREPVFIEIEGYVQDDEGEEFQMRMWRHPNDYPHWLPMPEPPEVKP